MVISNPALRSQPRHQAAAVIPSTQQASILDWLESTNRLIAREGDLVAAQFEDEAEELNELMLGDDGSYLDDDDDAIDDDDLEM
ncbi:MAG: DUF3134 domain-containing protein [Pseudanabaenaceae cyanobacterium]|jgi:hypothetical protein